jgi:hypothetical protein
MSEIQPVLGIRLGRIVRRQTAVSAPVFTTSLAGTLSEKLRACLWSLPPSGNDYNHLLRRYAWRR